MGSRFVICRPYDTMDPAAEPRPGPHGDILLPGPANEIPGDEEVAGVTRLQDHVQLVGQPLLHLLCERLPVPLLHAPRWPGAPGTRCRRRTVRAAGNLGRKYCLSNVRSTSSAIFTVFSMTSGRSGRTLRHLDGVLEVETLVVDESVLVVPVLRHPDADQDVVGLVMVVL